MEQTKAIVLGATGLIGSELLQLLIHDDYFSHIQVISRRPLSFSHEKISVSCIDMLDGISLEQVVESCNTVFCCIGTTQKHVRGNTDLYKAIDHDIPLRVAQLYDKAKFTHFSIVSSIGANCNSSNFYLKLKGEVEDSLQELPIPSLAIFRPSMLLGNRTESRPAESFAKCIAPIFSFVIPPIYKPIQAKNVAKAMLTQAKIKQSGTTIYTYNEILQSADNN